MKTSILTLLFLTLTSKAHALDFEMPAKHSSKYIVVGVSGLKTGRDEAESENIFSDKIGKTMEESGAWSNLNTNHKKIEKNAYLTHFSKDSEIQSVINLFLNEKGQCKEDLGLIMMVNSWGAKTSQKLAKSFLKKCHRLPELTVLIEGISKPTPIAYTKSLLSLNCVNYYQEDSSLHGGPIENCVNKKILNRTKKGDLYNAHIYTEWKGSSLGREIIHDYLNETLTLTFTKDLGVDFLKGL